MSIILHKIVCSKQLRRGERPEKQKLSNHEPGIDRSPTSHIIKKLPICREREIETTNVHKKKKKEEAKTDQGQRRKKVTGKLTNGRLPPEVR